MRQHATRHGRDVVIRALPILAAVWLQAACGDSGGAGPGPIIPVPTSTPTNNVLVGAGDICAYGPSSGPESTAALLDTIQGTIFTTGDNVNAPATADAFLTYFEPTWGRHKKRIRPTPGNHEYDVPNAAAYFAYFGGNAGEPGIGYYSYDIGSWHIVALNSEVPVGSGSPQEEWLISDLTANPVGCTIAYWHRPLFSSNGGVEAMRDLWRIIYRYGVDVVLNGHQHMYERFAPMNPDGVMDQARGIRQFVVGTGGAALSGSGAPAPNSEARGSAFGVLKLTLNDGSYDWEFVPAAGHTFRDFGTAKCK